MRQMTQTYANNGQHRVSLNSKMGLASNKSSNLKAIKNRSSNAGFSKVETSTLKTSILESSIESEESSDMSTSNITIEKAKQKWAQRKPEDIWIRRLESQSSKGANYPVLEVSSETTRESPSDASRVFGREQIDHGNTVYNSIRMIATISWMPIQFGLMTCCVYN